MESEGGHRPNPSATAGKASVASVVREVRVVCTFCSKRCAIRVGKTRLSVCTLTEGCPSLWMPVKAPQGPQTFPGGNLYVRDEITTQRARVPISVRYQQSYCLQRQREGQAARKKELQREASARFRAAVAARRLREAEEENRLLRHQVGLVKTVGRLEKTIDKLRMRALTGELGSPAPVNP